MSLDYTEDEGGKLLGKYLWAQGILNTSCLGALFTETSEYEAARYYVEQYELYRLYYQQPIVVKLK